MVILFAILGSLIQCGYVYYPPSPMCTEQTMPLNITAAMYNFNAAKWDGKTSLPSF
jgi:hypothetical protein